MQTSDHATIIEVLTEQARRLPHRAAFTIAEASCRDHHSISFGDLLSSGLRVATALKELGLRRGDRVILCLPTSLDMVVSLYGVLLAGGVCVPVYTTIASPRIGHWKAQASAIARVVQPIGAIVSRSDHTHMRSIVASQGEGLFTTTPEILLEGETSRPDDPVDVLKSDLALVQFTSGTTTQPRGAAITHSSLMANIDALVSGMRLDSRDISVSWLPPYHDMGLIGHIFTPVRCAAHQYLLPPQAFIENPARWLQLITEVSATQTTAPNAAYEICARKVTGRVRGELDLSSLRWALNGAELVHRSTIERFCRAFEPCGFVESALRPVYGLAEATLAATLGPAEGSQIDWIDRGRFTRDRSAQGVSPGHRDRISFVSVGKPIPGHELKVVDSHGRQLESGEVGEIYFRGPSVMQGYFNNPEATASAFDRDGWLRTGDLGYFGCEGMLFVTGRADELMIRGGKNLLPHDFEGAATSVAGIRAGRAVACGFQSARNGTEEIVLFAEVRPSRGRDLTQLRTQVSDTILDTTGHRPDRVVLLEPGALPKTTSGKLQRNAVKASFLEGLPMKGRRRHLSEAILPSLQSLAGLLEVRAFRLLGWR